MNGLAFIRRRCNLSQGQLAELLGVTRQAVNLWENRREPLPEGRRRQLSRFFGLEPELFGTITQAQKDTIVSRPCYLYRDGDGHAYYLFRREPPARYKILLDAETGGQITQDEQALLDKRELEEMLDALRRLVFPRERDRWVAADSIAAMYRMRLVLGGLLAALEAIPSRPIPHRMEGHYLIMQTELALALALGGMEAGDLPPCSPEEEEAPGLDRAHILSLSGELRAWLDRRSAETDARLQAHTARRQSAP